MLDSSYLQNAATAGQYAPQILVMTDPEYRILWANEAAERAFAPLQELVGRLCYEAIEGRSSVCPNCVVARSHASGKPEEDELRDVAENGRPLYLLVQAQPIRDEEGNAIAWLESTIALPSIQQLNMERKRLQSLVPMQESETCFASLAQAASIGIGISVSNRWVWLNELFASIFGYEPDEMIGADPLNLVLPEMREMIAERFNEISTTNSCADIQDLSIVRKDGVQRIVSTVLTCCVYRGEDAIMSVVRDVTEELRAVASLERRHQELKALNAMAAALERSLRLSDRLEESLRQAARITEADAAMIGLLNQGGTSVELFPDGAFPVPWQNALGEAFRTVSQAQLARDDFAVWSPGTPDDHDYLPELHTTGMAALLRMPLGAQDRTIGFLWLAARAPDTFGDVPSELLESLCHEIAMALANAQLFEQVDGRNKQLAAMNSIATALTQSLDISEVLNIALDEMMAITEAAAGAISLVDLEAGTVRLAAHREVADALHEMLREVRIADGWGARAVAADRVLVIGDLRTDPNTFPETLELGFRSAVCVPLKAHEQTVAVLNLLSHDVDHFTAVSEEFLLSVGSQIGLAVANARLFMEKADSEELYRDLFEAVPDPVVLISLDGAKVLRCNRLFREQFGYSLEDVSDLSIEEIIVPEDHSKTLVSIEALLSDEALASTQFEVRCLHKNGEVRDVLVHVVPYHARDKLLGFQAIARDVTDQKRLQTSLLRTEKLSALGQLVSGVAHELNNPLSTILLAAEMLLQDEQNATKRARLEAIVEQVSRSSALTEDLRLFARREEPHSELVDIHLLLERVRDLVAPAFRRENIELVMSLPDEIPPVAGNANQLEQVALNLMTNALQAMEGQMGNNSLTVTVETVASGGDSAAADSVPCVKLAFVDTGPGVSPDAKSRIFDPFYTSKPPGKGTGLGLSVSLGIAESHKGTIYLESATKGATFVVELPQAVDRGSVLSKALDIVDEDTSRPVDLGGLRILVVDDEAAIVELLTQMLQASNCRVDGVRSAPDALQKLASKAYDIVLCDVKMPLVQGSPGYAAIAHAYPGVSERMLLMSGDTASLETVQLFDKLQAPTLQKPFTYGQLVTLLRVVAGGGPRT